MTKADGPGSSPLGVAVTGYEGHSGVMPGLDVKRWVSGGQSGVSAAAE